MQNDLPPVETRDQAEAAMGIVAALHIQLSQSVSRQNKALLAARKRDAEIADLRTRIARQEERLKEWAQGHRKEEFGESKTLQLRHGLLRFKFGAPAIKLLAGWTDDLVLGQFRRYKRWRAYIRTKEELNRQRILADARPEARKLKPADLNKFGLSIVQEELFTVEPRLEQAAA